MEGLDTRLDALLGRIAALEARVGGREGAGAGSGGALPLVLPPSTNPASSIQAALDAELASKGVPTRSFLQVPADYYDHPLSWRQGALAAPSVHHLCKTLCLENTRAREPLGPFAPEALAGLSPTQRAALSRFFLVIVQYTARLDTEALAKGLRALAGGAAPGKAFNLRLAGEEDSARLTGYEHNAVTPVGVSGVQDGSLPLILASAVTALEPPLFWMGGGEVDLKLGLDTAQFVRAYAPVVMDVTVPEAEGAWK